MPALTKTMPVGTTQSSKPVTSHKLNVKSRTPRTTILHLCHDLDYGYPARETIDLSILTQRYGGWRALTTSSGGALVMECERAAVRHTHMPFDRQGLFIEWRNRIHLETLIQRERPSLLHVHGIEALPYACAASRAHRLPIIADITQPFENNARTQKLMVTLSQLSCLVRVPSEYMGHWLQDNFKLRADQIYHIPPGIDLNWYNVDAMSPERLHTLTKLWRMPEQATIVMVPMPMHPNSGHKIFLQAMAALKNDNVFAVLVGDDRTAPGTSAEIEAMVNQLRLNGKVVMPEYYTDLPAACWLSNVIVAPNTAPRGQVPEMLAAQAIGRAMVVTDVGANTEFIKKGETAWVVPPNDVKAMTEALHQAVSLSTEQRLSLADNAREFVTENFPQANWFNGMMDAYESLLSPVMQSSRKAA
jgi:glycosyltransferase involved in cell wall biosynthesis